MARKVCKICSEIVSKNTKQCPNCGNTDFWRPYHSSDPIRLPPKKRRVKHTPSSPVSSHNRPWNPVKSIKTRKQAFQENFQERKQGLIGEKQNTLRMELQHARMEQVRRELTDRTPERFTHEHFEEQTSKQLKQLDRVGTVGALGLMGASGAKDLAAKGTDEMKNAGKRGVSGAASNMYGAAKGMLNPFTPIQAQLDDIQSTLLFIVILTICISVISGLLSLPEQAKRLGLFVGDIASAFAEVLVNVALIILIPIFMVLILAAGAWAVLRVVTTMGSTGEFANFFSRTMGTALAIAVLVNMAFSIIASAPILSSEPVLLLLTDIARTLSCIVLSAGWISFMTFFPKFQYHHAERTNGKLQVFMFLFICFGSPLMATVGYPQIVEISNALIVVPSSANDTPIPESFIYQKLRFSSETTDITVRSLKLESQIASTKAPLRGECWLPGSEVDKFEGYNVSNLEIHFKVQKIIEETLVEDINLPLQDDFTGTADGWGWRTFEGVVPLADEGINISLRLIGTADYVITDDTDVPTTTEIILKSEQLFFTMYAAKAWEKLSDEFPQYNRRSIFAPALEQIQKAAGVAVIVWISIIGLFGVGLYGIRFIRLLQRIILFPPMGDDFMMRRYVGIESYSSTNETLGEAVFKAVFYLLTLTGYLLVPIFVWMEYDYLMEIFETIILPLIS